MSKVRTMGAGVLRLVQPTDVIKALFGPYRLDVAYPGDGQAFVCLDTSWGRPTWEDVEGELQTLAVSLGLVPKDGPDVHLKELVAMLAAHYGKDASGVQHLLEPEIYQDVTLSELFELAAVLDDGHGLSAVQLQSSTRGARPRLGECTGGGFYQSRWVVLRSGSGDAAKLGQRLDGALAHAGVDAAAEILREHLQGVVDGVVDLDVRKELERRLGLPG